jgi:hypothetical protein
MHRVPIASKFAEPNRVAYFIAAAETEDQYEYLWFSRIHYLKSGFVCNHSLAPVSHNS